MNIEKWLSDNASSLSGKTVAITGSTGGLGREICLHLARLGASLILVDRNRERSERFANELREGYSLSVECVTADLEDVRSVAAACERLKEFDIDVFIHNAGAYSIPRKICENGYDNVFNINFVSPYFITKKLLPQISARGGRIVAVSSIAHDYSRTNECDVDFSGVRAASKVYGNAKRYLTYSLFGLFEGETGASLSIAHPGITLTNITAHYPKIIFAIIKYPMKLIFTSPRVAALNVIRGVFDSTASCEWIGPRVFDVWGLPKKKKLSTAKREEREYISGAAERIYLEMLEFVKNNGRETKNEDK